MMHIRVLVLLVFGLAAHTVCASADFDLYVACQNIEHEATWSEVLRSICHCKTVESLRLEDIKSKLESGANSNTIIDINGTIKLAALHWAVRNNNPRLVEILLQYEAFPSMPAQLTGQHERTITPLALAMENYNKFHKRGGDGYLYLGKKIKPIEYPKAHTGNQKVAQLLLKAGALPEGRDQQEYAQKVKAGTLPFSHPRPRSVGF